MRTTPTSQSVFVDNTVYYTLFSPGHASDVFLTLCISSSFIYYEGSIYLLWGYYTDNIMDTYNLVTIATLFYTISPTLALPSSALHHLPPHSYIASSTL